MTFPAEGNSSAVRPAEAADPSVHAGGGRFRIEREIGRGGMACVLEAVDTSSGKRVALKRLLPGEDPRKYRRALQLFEREYHTLAHLAHPRVVAVYDYGIDELGPFYTMELLDGGDLQHLAPLDWRRTCALARDLCSALSLLHSRRMVHRDLSPRNARCTSDGLAKLIDFGAMVAMGTSRQVVGTPAYCAPEALNQQPLDQRADLYSLGATLYYSLVARHAYPAKSFAQLRDQWRTRPLPPSTFRPDVPPALDALVLDLMHLDPAARPANAAEVIERLAAIEGRAADESLLVPQSYLSTPNLVGRETHISRARAKTLRAIRGRGGALMLEGASGAGRSRLLDACVLEGKLLGALVLRADRSDAQGDYGAVRALASQLFDALPELALRCARPHSSVLAHVIPEQLARASGEPVTPDAPGEQLRARVQQALREWLFEVGRQRPLVLAIDDVQALDEPSAAFLALLAHDLRRRALLVVVTTETGAAPTSPAALKLLSDASTRLTLEGLSSENTEKLLRSVFGDVPQMQLLAHKLHGLSDGNPRDVMHLAQHLVDRGLVRYAAGAWSLPASIDPGDLPSNMAQALRARTNALSPSARELARIMALCPERGLTVEECAGLSNAAQPARALAFLDELVEAQVVQIIGEAYVLAHRGWSAALQADLAPDVARSLHLQLSQLFERRGDESFRVARHLLRAGEIERGLDALIEHAESSTKLTDQDSDAYFKLVQSMPADWSDCYEQAIALGKRLGRPRRQLFLLQSRFSGLVAVMGILDRVHSLELLDQLCRESGLADWNALDPSLEGMPRLVKALEQTQQRYASASENDRVLEPILAIRQLARAVIQTIGTVATTLDDELRRALPSLEPLEPLSPALVVVSLVMRGNIARTTARAEVARAEYVRLLELTSRPDRAGLDESHHRFVHTGVTCGLGMIEAAMGLESCLAWADAIAADPLHQVNALLIRMLHHLFQGDMREADRCKERVELLRLQNSPRQWFEGTHLLGQIVASAAADDLTRVKQTLDEIEPLAQRFPCWLPVRDYALAEYHRIRGDHQGALAPLEAALAATEPGSHQLWPNIAGAYVRALVELGRAQEARDRGLNDLAAAERAGLGYTCNYLRMPLALAHAQLGESDAALQNAHAAIDTCTRLGSKGLLLALAFETRARVAVLGRDESAFTQYASLCADQLSAYSSRALTSKYEKLKQTAMRAEFEVPVPLADAAELTEAITASQLTSLIETCHGAVDRAQRSLMLLLTHSHASEGFLYLLGDGGPELAARVGATQATPSLLATVRDYVEAELCDQEQHTAALAAEPLQSASESALGDVTGTTGERYRLVLLTHQISGNHVVTGVAVMVVPPAKRFVYPAGMASELSRVLHESGDVVASMVQR